MKPTEEQKKVFLQWCGIQCYYTDEVNDDIEAWICPPDSEKTIAFYGLTLDFLFKYAVPKINKPVQLFKFPTQEFYTAKVGATTQVRGTNPALALFWALFKAMGNET